jgi:threonine/homoserine/homoserine lactone efflux protein
MPTGDRFLAFLATAFVLIWLPGPSVLFVVSRGVAMGRRAALATVLGNTAGMSTQLVLVAAGLGSVLAHSIALLDAVRVAGAAYLVLLGARMFLGRRGLARVLDATEIPRSGRRIVREGYIVGATNPKALIIFTAVLPQFVARGGVALALQIAVLGAICVGIALVSDSSWAILSGSARHWLRGSPRRLELIGGAGGLAVIGLGVRLIVTGRRG